MKSKDPQSLENAGFLIFQNNWLKSCIYILTKLKDLKSEVKTVKYTDALIFKGKVVMITGAGGSLGSGMVKGFAECGATVVACDIRFDAAKLVVDELGEFKGDSIPLEMDVTDCDDVQKKTDYIFEKFGRIDFLINHAGMNIRKPAVDFNESDWDKVVDTNMKGIFFVAQSVGMKMIKQGFGSIVNTASVSAARGHKNLAIYAATKGGIAQITKVLAHEWASYGIRVNAIGPGYVLTNQTQHYLDDEEKYEELISKVPMNRFGKIEEIVGPTLFLCSDLAGYITGQTLYIEGGRMID